MMRSKKNILVLMLVFVFLPRPVFAMHIMEGFLPLGWSVFWSLVSLPFIVLGLRSINKTVHQNPRLKMLLGLAGAFAFVLSALKLPSVTGSSSHPTGVGLGTILFGPLAMSVLGFIVLIFQAVLLAHGGITTLGANTFSMAIAGPLVAFTIYRAVQKCGGKPSLAVFLAAFFGNFFTYVVTSLQLALAFPAEIGGFVASLTKFLSIFAVTQVPLAISEGLLTVVIFNVLTIYSKDELRDLSVMFEEGAK
ncbi:MAG: energy-coupling factor ABC transporter permease [Firmicutes bacterium]|nr:energy-coupling factor ABC transporter permease [Bacillota bacterium]